MRIPASKHTNITITSWSRVNWLEINEGLSILNSELEFDDINGLAWLFKDDSTFMIWFKKKGKRIKKFFFAIEKWRVLWEKKKKVKKKKDVEND